MSKKKKIFLHSLFIILITGFFLYYLFPSSTVADYIVFQLNRINPTFNVSVASIKPVLPPGLKFKGVNIHREDNSLLEAGQIKICPGILSLFQEKDTIFIKLAAYEGVLDCKIDVTRNVSPIRIAVDADISEVQLKEIKILQDLTKHSISAVLDGNLTYSNGDAKKNKKTGTADIILSDCNIELQEPVLKQANLTFETIEAKLELNNKLIKFKQCELKGNQMEGKIEGYISIKTPSDKSTLKLTGTLTPQPALLEDLGAAAQLLFNQKTGQNSISFRVEGTLKDPSFSLK